MPNSIISEQLKILKCLTIYLTIGMSRQEYLNHNLFSNKANIPINNHRPPFLKRFPPIILLDLLFTSILILGFLGCPQGFDVVVVSHSSPELLNLLLWWKFWLLLDVEPDVVLIFVKVVFAVAWWILWIVWDFGAFVKRVVVVLIQIFAFVFE